MTTMHTTAASAGAPAARDIAWPMLPLDQWQDTYATLHMWLQIVGKTRLALAPMENHWWQVALYLTPRGLTTSPIPPGLGTFAVELDFLDHYLSIRTSDGNTRTMPLRPRTVADFYAEYMEHLRALQIDAHIRPVPVEVVTAVPFPHDREHAAYDPDAATRCWRILQQTDRILKRFRGRFLGKASPVHFFWGAFDLAMTRFSGRRAPLHGGGVPNCPDYVMHEAYSHQCSSCGFWPGSPAIPEPAFYAYTYPEPAGYRDRPIRPGAAYYHQGMGEFILPYEAVRAAPSPDDMLLEFAQSTYDAAADAAKWDRAALDRPPAEWP
ncbi:MAG TPA: DUF5996 family protein [Gemmatimonadales bacterium]|nr:DUF5996 family protein [Gemmatimonadales bacterium]